MVRTSSGSAEARSAVALVGLGIVAVATMLAGFIAGLVSWIGALLNTAQLASKAWFIALLLTGIFSLGFIAMIAYVVAGPDGTADAAREDGPGARRRGQCLTRATDGDWVDPLDGGQRPS